MHYQVYFFRKNDHSLHSHYRKKNPQNSKLYIKKKEKRSNRKNMFCSYLHKMPEHQLLEVWENCYMQINSSGSNEVWDMWRNKSFPLKTFSISHLAFLEDIIWLIRLYFTLYFHFVLSENGLCILLTCHIQNSTPWCFPTWTCCNTSVSSSIRQLDIKNM